MVETTSPQEDGAAETAVPARGSRRPRGDAFSVIAITAAVAGLILALFLVLELALQDTSRGGVLVPDVKMMTSEQARSAIEAAGFVAGEEKLVATATVVPDRVLGQDPEAGTTAEKGSRIDLTVTSAPKTISMPHLVGMAGAAAAEALTERQIEPVVIEVHHGAVRIGKVFAQYPHTGSDAIQGQVGVVLVSAGPPHADAVAVPPVEGEKLSTAVRTLARKGLSSIDCCANLPEDSLTGAVARQVPPPGSLVRPGASVALLRSVSAD